MGRPARDLSSLCDERRRARIDDAIDGLDMHRKNRPLVSGLQQAYAGLMFVPESEDGSRTISLARYGRFEVRLVEFRHRGTLEPAPFWLELYRHDVGSSLDSCRCDDLDLAESAAEHLTSLARDLHESHAGSGALSSSRGPSWPGPGPDVDSSLSR